MDEIITIKLYSLLMQVEALKQMLTDNQKTRFNDAITLLVDDPERFELPWLPPSASSRQTILVKVIHDLNESKIQ